VELEDVETDDLLAECQARLEGLMEVEATNDQLLEKLEALEEEAKGLRLDLSQKEAELEEALDKLEEFEGEEAPIGRPELWELLRLAYLTDPTRAWHLLELLGWRKTSSDLATEQMLARSREPIANEQ
jgi:hypothetical protein